MNRLTLALLLLAPSFAAAQTKDVDGYVPMWNGKDLTGWVNVNCHPSTFFVKNDMIVTTGHPTGFLRTDRQYENFVAEFDWMHQEKVNVGNSGFFVWADPIPAIGTGYTRGIEVQVLVNLTYKNKKGEITASSHGDLFSIWGATCKPERPHPDGAERCLPDENRAKGGGEWNHYKVTANDGTIRLEVNGKEVSAVHKCNPRKGYLALESEGAECWFKNLKIKELPSTNPKPNECARSGAGHWACKAVMSETQAIAKRAAILTSIAGSSLNHSGIARCYPDCEERMTKVQARYDLTAPLDEALQERIANAPSLFGLTRVRVAPSLTEVTVDYDSSRLTLAQVDSALHRAGIPAIRK